MNIDLTGKIAVITGATGELGRVMARTLAQCGSDIAVHYLKNETNAQKLASDLASFITGAYIPVSGGNVIPGI